MKSELLSLENKVVGEVVLDESIFGLDVRTDIIHKVVNWQRAKARSGTHAVKTVGEVSGTTKKPFKQKGTGNARQGNARGVQRRGGGIAHGPQVRSHAVKLQKKVRRLGLKHALSAKTLEGNLHVVDSVDVSRPQTSYVVKSLSCFGVGKFFIVDADGVNKNLKLSVASIRNAKAVPVIGVNVYDVIDSDHILISKDALVLLEKRLK